MAAEQTEIEQILEEIDGASARGEWSRVKNLAERVLAREPDNADARAELAAVERRLTRMNARRSDGQASPPAARRAAGRAFVGRTHELEELAAALDGAIDGAGQVVMLVGEPGIGKTRTAQELSGEAEQRGVPVCWGRCFEREGAPAYYPWTQALRALVARRRIDEVWTDLGHRAQLIAALLPELAEGQTGEGNAPQTADAESSQLRLFDAVASMLVELTSGEAAVLVLDDLHWADLPSLELLEHVARVVHSSRLLLLATYRDVELNRRHPLRTTLAELSREQLMSRIVLRGLDRASVGDYVRAVAGPEAPDGLLEAVFDHTEGNPFFMSEVVRFLDRDGSSAVDPKDRSDWDIRVPEGVREVIGLRLDRLSENAQQILTLAALLGRELSHRQLLAVAGDDVGEESLMNALDEVLQARMLEEVAGRVGHYQFSHALVQETLEAELTVSERTRRHAQIAVGLEHFYREQADEHASELAAHFAAAETVLGTDQLVSYSLTAGDRELQRFAPQAAVDHYQRVIDAIGDRPPCPELARAHFGRANNIRTTQDDLDYAFDYYVSAGDLAKAVEVVEFSGHGLRIWAGDPRPAARIRRALELVEAGSSSEVRLQTALVAAANKGEWDVDAARAARQRALEVAEQLGDRRLVASALAAGFVFEPELEGRLRLAQQVIDLARTEWLADIEGDALAVAATVSRLLGRDDDARTFIDEIVAVFDRMSDGARRHSALRAAFTFGLERGRWRYALDVLDRLHGDDVRHNPYLCICHYEIGESELADERLRWMMERSPMADHTHVVRAIVRIALMTGRERWFDHARRSAQAEIDAGSRPEFMRRAYESLAGMAFVTGQLEGADEIYVRITDLPEGRYYAGVDGLYMEGARDEPLGLIAAVRGESDLAARHLRSAIEHYAGARCPPRQAWAWFHLGQVLGGGREASEAFAAARAIAEELDMVLLRQRLEEATADRRSPDADGYPGGLTGREVEVLQLVADGLTDGQIGERLFISPRTVANHVAHIREKTGSANRAEIVRYAADNDLLGG